MEKKMTKPKSIIAWGLIPKEYNEEQEIKSIQFHKPKNPITYEFNHVVQVEILQLKKELK